MTIDATPTKTKPERKNNPMVSKMPGLKMAAATRTAMLRIVAGALRNIDKSKLARAVQSCSFATPSVERVATSDEGPSSCEKVQIRDPLAIDSSASSPDS